jgi:hypothetical protein
MEDAMDEQARQQAFVSALVTEHFVAQSARSTTIAEANGRTAIYLTSLSSALVAFGFVAQVARRLDPFSGRSAASPVRAGRIHLHPAGRKQH